MISIPTTELKQRFANKQVRLNDEPITIDIWRTLKLDTAIEYGDWLFNTITKNPEFKQTLSICRMMWEPDQMADTNSPKLQKIFNGKAILRLSKKEVFVIDC